MPEVPVPFSEPPYLLGIPSPYYDEGLRSWQKKCNEFINENLTQHALDWERAGEVPTSLWDNFFKANMLIPCLAPPLPLDHFHKLGIYDVLGTKLEDITYMHTMIYGDEMSRSGFIGPGGSITTGFSFAVPPIYKFGSRQLQEKFLPDVLTGKLRTCIAITEPSAGSDVANISTTAEKTKDGKHYIVNGAKKWITNGSWSHIATMAVRTGGSGPGGISLLIVPLLGQEGVSMRRIKCTGQYNAGATYIELDNVKVPVENLLGVENQGMKYIMTNFNHERLSIAVGTVRSCRVALSQAFGYVMNREAFGKKLIDQPVVRHRLAKCGAEMESLWSWVESFCYAMSKMKKIDADRELGGLTALVKARAGIVFDECARTAVLLHGGNGFTQSGQGEIVERLYREINGVRIPGGSEDVMLDLAIRQLYKNYQSKVGDHEPKMLSPGGVAKL